MFLLSAKPKEHRAYGCAGQHMTLTCPAGQTIALGTVGWGRPYLQSLRQKCNLDTRNCPFRLIQGRSSV